MCCGKDRAMLAQGSMSSQGSKLAPNTGGLRRRRPILVAYFEYTGRTAMTVIAPVTGLRYSFPAPGSRVAVDLRDRKSLAAIPQLRQVRSL